MQCELIFIFTVRKRSLQRLCCLSVHGGGGESASRGHASRGFCIQRGVSIQRGLCIRWEVGQSPPFHRILRDTVIERGVRILLECILVFFYQFTKPEFVFSIFVISCRMKKINLFLSWNDQMLNDRFSFGKSSIFIRILAKSVEFFSVMVHSSEEFIVRRWQSTQVKWGNPPWLWTPR